MTEDEPSARLIGYARVSTDDQDVAMQIKALVRFGVKESDIYSESMSGSKKNRPELMRALRAVRAGDTFVVWKFDRIARSLNHLLEIVEGLEREGVSFESLTEKIETKTPAGKLFMHMLGAFAQFERDIIQERTKTGVANALANGVKFGAKEKLKEKDMPEVWKLIREQNKTLAEVGIRYGVSGQTIARRLKTFERPKSK